MASHEALRAHFADLLTDSVHADDCAAQARVPSDAAEDATTTAQLQPCDCLIRDLWAVLNGAVVAEWLGGARIYPLAKGGQVKRQPNWEQHVADAVALVEVGRAGTTEGDL